MKLKINWYKENIDNSFDAEKYLEYHKINCGHTHTNNFNNNKSAAPP